MRIVRSEKENTHYFINYFDSLYSGFGFYVNDYYHAQTDALEILKHQEVKQVNSNLITLSPQKTSDVGIIFYPGAKVENTAYLPLLEQLERKGYSCYLVNKPFKMAKCS